MESIPDLPIPDRNRVERQGIEYSQDVGCNQENSTELLACMRAIPATTAMFSLPSGTLSSIDRLSN